MAMASKLVQYVVVRGDLLHSLGWPTGAVIAQACHACTAVIWLFKDDPNTIEYAKDIDNMHKVILQFQITPFPWVIYFFVSWKRLRRYVNMDQPQTCILKGLTHGLKRENITPKVKEAKDVEQLKNISMALTADNVDHKLWIEQPENYPTCLATKPYGKEQIQKYFKKLKLFK